MALCACISLCAPPPSSLYHSLLFCSSRSFLPLPSLAHLHEGLDMKVVHRDVKASNVLLDEQWNAKLGDFALAKVIGHDQGPAATRVLGTFG